MFQFVVFIADVSTVVVVIGTNVELFQFLVVISDVIVVDE